jgi:Na+-transporting methylmalonyl-CoA/oxaloacetate decarboxylase gamma subunit
MSDLVLSLQITAVGMGLVFGAIVVLWGLMSLLTALSRDKPSVAAASEQSPAMYLAPAEDEGMKAQAAAVAVATALAEQGSSTAHPLPPPPTAIVSAWQLGMRTRQMYQKGNGYKKAKK